MELTFKLEDQSETRQLLRTKVDSSDVCLLEDVFQIGYFVTC